MRSDTREDEALLRQRIVVLDGEITDDAATVVIAKLLFLDDENPSAPAHLRLWSPGGQVSAALAIRDTMDALSCPVHVHAGRDVSGISCLLLAHGTRGERTASHDSRIMLTTVYSARHLFSLDSIDRTEALVVEMLATDTGQPRETILRDMRRSLAFSSAEARAYGLIDHVRG